MSRRIVNILVMAWVIIAVAIAGTVVVPLMVSLAAGALPALSTCIEAETEF